MPDNDKTMLLFILGRYKGTAMDLSNAGVLRLFNVINADNNNYITTEELKKAGADHVINKEEFHELEKTFSLNKYGLAVSLETYMKGMNYYRQQLGISELFTEDNFKWSDRAFVLKEVRRDGIMLSRANTVLQNDPEIVSEAIQSNPLALLYASPELKRDRDITLPAIQKNGHCWTYIDKLLKNDKRLALLALETRPNMIIEIKDHFPADQDIWLCALSGDMTAIEQLPAQLTRDPVFMKKLAEQIKWADIVRTKGTTPSPERSALLQKIYDLQRPVIEELRAMNIYHPERFRNMQEASCILSARKNCTAIDPAKRTALLTYAAYDDTQAFENNQISDLLKKGYTVIYYEVPDETSFYEVVKAEAQKHPITLLVIAGHGTPGSIHLKDHGKGISAIDERWYLDLSDEHDLQVLDPFLKDTVIVLESCSTGKGKELAKNMVNTIRKALPHVKKVFGPTDDTSVSNYLYTPGGDVFDVIYRSDGTKAIETFGL